MIVAGGTEKFHCPSWLDDALKLNWEEGKIPRSEVRIYRNTHFPRPKEDPRKGENNAWWMSSSTPLPPTGVSRCCLYFYRKFSNRYILRSG